ncbi:hypothetical protein FACS1894109_02710 [Spirochaetia bacterium]|nr:hypothetical protein FACS1894109_02710 [Spirochaetia bacterium]
MKKRTIFLFGCLLLAGSIIGFSSCQKKDSGTGKDSLITLDVYSQAANFSGIQPGWYGELVKQKFNIALNIIAPQAGGGDALYQTRAAAGNLGDIVLLNNPDFRDSVKAGLIKDISAEISKYTNVSAYMTQINAFNSGLEGAKTGQIFGIPTQMTNTSPTTYTNLLVYSSPKTYWDYFAEVGAPQMKNLDDLLNVMAQIQKNHPVNKDGDPAYAVSLWKDWDGTSIENVNQPLKWYGAEVGNDNGASVLIDYKGGITPLTDDNAQYLKLLKFFFKANQMGLVDPDSGTQPWDNIVTKISTKRVYLLWYSWQNGFWNSTAHGESRENLMPISVDDMVIFQNGDTYFGSERTWGIGSKVSGEKLDRVLSFIDWLASPEGIEYMHWGIPGFNYEERADGTHERTPIGEVVFSENPPVPESFGLGTGGWNDGNQKINQWLISDASTNPKTGTPYMVDLWPAEIEKAKTATSREWAARYGAEDQVAYLQKNNMLGIVPSVNVALPNDSTDMKLVRSQCGDIVKDTSWKMIFARNEAEFNRLWADMKTQLDGFGWAKLVEYDTQKCRLIVDARAKALSDAR